MIRGEASKQSRAASLASVHALTEAVKPQDAKVRALILRVTALVLSLKRLAEEEVVGVVGDVDVQCLGLALDGLDHRSGDPYHHGPLVEAATDDEGVWLVCA
jgi:hypothetical protein